MSRSRQVAIRKRSSRGRRPPAKRHHSVGARIVLIAALIFFVLWVLMRIPSPILTLLLVLLLLIAVVLGGTWLAFRSRPPRYSTRPSRSGSERGEELVQLAETAEVVAMRPVQLSDLRRLSPKEFEHFVGALLEATGRAFELRRVGGAGDQGADLLGKDRFNRPFMVQCKRYFGHNVTSSEMRDFLGAKSSVHRADEAWFVTTASFTRGAEEAAERLRFLGQVVLIDGNTLVDLIHECWEKLPAHWQERLLGRAIF